MAAIVINSENTKHLKLLAELAEQLGENVSRLSSDQAEDIHLGMLMKKEKTGKDVSRKSVFKHLDGK